MRKKSWTRYQKDLEALYQQALTDSKLAVALKIKALQIKIQQQDTHQAEAIDMEALLNQHLDKLIKLIDAKLSSAATPSQNKIE